MPRPALSRFGGLLVAIIAALASVGCGPTTVSQKLIGRWEGRPDTFAAQRQRDPIPTAPGYQKKDEPAQPVVQSELVEKVEKLQPGEETELEQFDFVVTLEFRPDGQVDMWLDGGEKRTGAWRVLSTDVGVSRLELSDGMPPENEGGEGATSAPSLTKRRFSLKLNKTDDGFTLREEGVDPRFGWLYFERVSGPQQ